MRAVRRPLRFPWRATVAGMVSVQWIRRFGRRLVPTILSVLPVACGGPSAPPVASPATPPAASAAPSPVEQPVSRGFFHEVRSDTATLYLLGSVHVSKGDVFPMEEPIEQAFEGADTLVLELDLSEQGRLSAMTQTMEEALYPEGESLEQALDAETLALLEQRLDQRGIPLAAMSRLRPWVVAITLTVLELQRAGYEAEGGVDLHFAKRAEGKKKIVGLETAGEQLSIFTSMTEGEQSLMLRQTLETLGDSATMLDQAMAAWQRSDEAALEAELLGPMRRDPQYHELYEAVFVERNERMAERLEDMLRGDGTLFVVVGAGHLVGPDGVVARLRDAGYDAIQR